MARLLWMAGVLGLLFAAALAWKNRHEPDPEGQRAIGLRMVLVFGVSGVVLGTLVHWGDRRAADQSPDSRP
jgi:ABC-type Fe3+ transport system permease subunit